MRTIFFDLDGTLCESKQLVEPKMLYELERLNKKYKILLVSGAELSRMLIQCPMRYITFMAQNGNEVYDNEKILWKNDLLNKEDILRHINLLAHENGVKIGDDMIDDRGSQISFSFIGHHSSAELKKGFDLQRKIRSHLLDKFPFKGAVIGGTTCIDYIPATKGENVERFIELRRMKPSECLYIGDAFMDYGNDSTVMGVVPIFKVRSPLDTLRFVKQLW